MSQYIVDKRDLQFVLFEQLHLERITDFERYRHLSREDFDIVLDEAAKVAAGLLSPLNQLGDREGCKLVNGGVQLPPGYEAAYERFFADGWHAPHHNVDHGGQGLPVALSICVNEMFIGANSSFMFFPGLTVAAAHVIENFGTEAQKALFLDRMYSGQWTGTMCLTEPHAGTAVGDLSTTATEVEGEDYFHIKGDKIFISAGDGPVGGNIIHLVLARIPGDPLGTKGLSLFIVPKYRIGADASQGESNHVVTTAVEHKMGINASPTCALSFGQDGECRGTLLGERRQGIVAMFQMMNEARIICGLQGAALANASYQQALAYARDRVQGPKTTDRNGSNGAVAIIEHPDVRRNLMIMKALSEGTRALLYTVAHYYDRTLHATNEADRTRYGDLTELLVPICKAYATDFGFKVTERGIQVFGGYGYIREYPMEQYMRDVKIASLYEGTNGIQALDLLGRKMRQKGGGLFLTWLQEANTFLSKHKDHPILGDSVAALDAAKNALCEAAFSLPALGASDAELFVLQATPFLECFGHVVVGMLLVEQALLAQSSLDEIVGDVAASDEEARRELLLRNSEARFYDGKIKCARFFVAEFVPDAVRIAQGIKRPDRSALDIAF